MTEDTAKNLSYLDLASRPKYVVHPLNNRLYGACHGWCFTNWVRSEIGNDRDPRCLHCNQEIDRLDGKLIRPLFREEELDLALEAFLEMVFNPPRIVVLIRDERASVEQVERFLQETPTTQGDLEWGMVTASGFGERAVLEMLLTKGPLSEERRAQAIRLAIDEHRENVDPENYREILRLLLQIRPLSDLELRPAVLQAAKNGRKELVRTLLENRQITEELRGEAVASAINTRAAPLPLVEFLLGTGPISEDWRGQAIERTARLSCPEIARLLLANGPISERRRGLGVIRAAKTNNKEILQLLLSNGPITEEARGEAVVRALSFEIVDILLKNGPIPTPKREEAVVTGMWLETQQMKALLESGDISDEARGEAVIAAAKHRCDRHLSLLLASGPISNEDREEAAKHAWAQKHLRAYFTLKPICKIRDLKWMGAAAVGAAALSVGLWHRAEERSGI